MTRFPPGAKKGAQLILGEREEIVYCVVVTYYAASVTVTVTVAIIVSPLLILVDYYYYHERTQGNGKMKSKKMEGQKRGKFEVVAKGYTAPFYGARQLLYIYDPAESAAPAVHLLQ